MLVIAALVGGVTISAQADGGSLSAIRLRCEYAVAPHAVDAAKPRLSWELVSSVRGDRQTAYRVIVASSSAKAMAGSGDLWDSGKRRSGESAQIAYGGRKLTSRQQAFWRVRVWDAVGRTSRWSDMTTFGMGLLARTDWKAKWISCAQTPAGADSSEYLPAPMFRREFRLDMPVRRAVVYATAAGVYELYANGRRVSSDVFRPGWTQYDVRNYYQAYDVTLMLHRGVNTLGAMLGDGWYGLHHEGRGRLALLAQLHVELDDGSSLIIGTDTRWTATCNGPIRMSDMYNGETYDARLEQAGWATPGYRARGWSPARIGIGTFKPIVQDVTEKVRAAAGDNGLAIGVTNATFGDPAYGYVKELRVEYRLDGGKLRRAKASENSTLRISGTVGALTIVRAQYGAFVHGADVMQSVLQSHPGPAVRRTDTVKPVRVTRTATGVFVYDLGQNFAGWTRLKVKGPRGTQVRLRFAEMLNPDGTIYTTNLRDAKCTDYYTLRGGATEVWEPRFTFHGFRYVEVTGYPGTPGRDAITGVVLNSDASLTSGWRSSDPRLNRLFKNIVWGQRSNYLEVPTDCPQRNERMGWTGDAQAFIGTGVYNMDVAGFMTAWMRTFNDCQYPDGGYPNVAPCGGGVSPAWGDAGVICPWACYQTYADTRIITDHWPNMQRWIAYLEKRSNGLVRPAEGFGDWVSVGEGTPTEVIATAYFAYGAKLMSEMAAATGRKDDARRYADLFMRIRAAFNRAFVDGEGRICGNSQTDYLMALAFDLAPKAQRAQVFGHLLERLEKHQWHLTTGFLGVNLLLPVLTENGRPDLAWRLMTTKTYPSWLYSVEQGATTIWERWDGWRHDKGFQDPGMNSFNHYTFGSCGRWMMGTAAGIASEGPGYRKITIRPVPGGGLTWLKAHYDSIRGRIATEWRVRGRAFTLNVTVPANTEATVYVPARSASLVTESGAAPSAARGVRLVRRTDGAAVYRVGGGTYAFKSTR